MRGTRYDFLIQFRPIGIIPAYAGNTLNVIRMCRIMWDHPRVCGEHRTLSRKKSASAGSSPRVRGTLQPRRFLIASHGIIPAYAGNTTRVLASPTFQRDHPRVCGEHFSKQVRTVVYVGSSPRMRGTPVFLESSYCPVGIIPAYAGNTTSTAVPLPLTRDHPRVCGEHPDFTARISACWGSSPRMRGTRLPAGAVRGGRGIIPAYAGNTMASIPGILCQPDHPRVCGEH